MNDARTAIEKTDTRTPYIGIACQKFAKMIESPG